MIQRHQPIVIPVMQYLQLDENGELPGLEEQAPFKAVIAQEEPLSAARQQQVARWLVEQGGLCVMVCGADSEGWKDDIRAANLEQVSIEDMQPEQFVMVTLHPNERLRSVFWHAKKVARHTHVKIKNVVVLHVGRENRSVEYQAMFSKA